MEKVCILAQFHSYSPGIPWEKCFREANSTASVQNPQTMSGTLQTSAFKSLVMQNWESLSSEV